MFKKVEIIQPELSVDNAKKYKYFVLLFKNKVC